MSKFRFLHAADIHLDSPLSGLQSYHGCPDRSPEQATRMALENMVRLALQQQVDFVLIAGDLYDGKWQDHSTGLFFISQMSLLRHAGIPVVVIRGNHDAESKITGHLRLPENVELLPSGKITRANNPIFDRLGVDVFGFSYQNQAETESVVGDFPVANVNRYTIGLLHTSLEGDSQHERYVPCSLADLHNKDYQYWALGHIHKRKIHSRNPYVVFPGNLQGRHVKESGEKGSYVVDVDLAGKTSSTFFGLDVLRWDVLQIDLSDLESYDQVRDCVIKELKRDVDQKVAANQRRYHDNLTASEQSGEEIPLHQNVSSQVGEVQLNDPYKTSEFDWVHFAIRVELIGQTLTANSIVNRSKEIEDDIRSLLIDLGRNRFWLEKVKNKTTLPKKTAPQSSSDSFDPSKVIHQLAEQPASSAKMMDSVNKTVDDLLRHVPDSIQLEMDWVKNREQFLVELLGELPRVIQAVADQDDNPS